MHQHRTAKESARGLRRILRSLGLSAVALACLCVTGCTGILMASHPTYLGNRISDVHREALSPSPRLRMEARLSPGEISAGGFALNPESRWYCRQIYQVTDKSPRRTRTRKGVHNLWNYGIGGVFDAAAIVGLSLSSVNGDSPNGGVAAATYAGVLAAGALVFALRRMSKKHYRYVEEPRVCTTWKPQGFTAMSARIMNMVAPMRVPVTKGADGIWRISPIALGRYLFVSARAGHVPVNLRVHMRTEDGQITAKSLRIPPSALRQHSVAWRCAAMTAWRESGGNAPILRGLQTESIAVLSMVSDLNQCPENQEALRGEICNLWVGRIARRLTSQSPRRAAIMAQTITRHCGAAASREFATSARTLLSTTRAENIGLLLDHGTSYLPADLRRKLRKKLGVLINARTRAALRQEDVSGLRRVLTRFGHRLPGWEQKARKKLQKLQQKLADRAVAAARRQARQEAARRKKELAAERREARREAARERREAARERRAERRRRAAERRAAKRARAKARRCYANCRRPWRGWNPYKRRFGRWQWKPHICRQRCY